MTDLMKSIRELDESELNHESLGGYILRGLKHAMSDEYKEYRKKMDEEFRGKEFEFKVGK